jgi:hypothetical protein
MAKPLPFNKSFIFSWLNLYHSAKHLYFFSLNLFILLSKYRLHWNFKKILMAKLLSFGKTFCLLAKLLSLLNKPFPLIKPFFYQLNIYFWQNQVMNACILSNPQAQKTYHENKALIEWRRKLKPSGSISNWSAMLQRGSKIFIDEINLQQSVTHHWHTHVRVGVYLT